MNKKIIIALLAVSVLLILGASAYSLYINNELNQRLDFISEDINESITEMQSNINNLVDFSDALESSVSDINTELTIIDKKIDQNIINIGTLVEEVSINKGRYSELKREIDGVVLELSEDRSRLAANKMYDTVIQSVVRISDGVNTIGSGYVYDNQGHVITAHHVSAELREIFVVFDDGRTSRASIVGSSESSDVSVLLIHNQLELSPVRMGDSSDIQIGEAVIAIGSPFDLSGTVTSGIVSQIDRAEIIGDEVTSRLISNLIQFDAAANFGNSGGPLFNIDGDVIGLIIARIGPTSGEGISYAVSANKVKKVADTIISTGFYDYPWLGIGVDNITPEMTEDFNLNTINGIVVTAIFPGSPAEQTGLELDDIIISVNGRTMRKVDDLTSYLGESTSPGDILAITINRNGELITLNVTLGIQ
ncbi:MAG: trypsin-like peptidase domain-containing protein [Dehalococcoidales bacterium]|nr:MAG: trypsin-like peptidase domain-containing protein [Dehalococcoidales bacterium]